MKNRIVFLSVLFFTHTLCAQITLTDNNRSTASIVINDNSVNYTAATLLQTFIYRISGAEIPIKKDGKVKKGDIFITNENLSELKKDGFLLSTKDGVLRIVSLPNEGKGSIYGVVTLLEKYLGISYFGENEYSLTKQSNIVIPLIHFVDNPAFRYRQTQCYATKTDSIYKLWNRLEEPGEIFAANYWVHTFDKLLPSDKYGKNHPEYYSYFNGKRHPGKASQWCLTNSEVFEIVANRIDSIFKANPQKHIISVSQNDGNYTNCTCENCKAIDDREGAFSGSLITFLNKLAARFPDKEFSTLAYLYTMKPPKHIKPLPNVNIMLCDIDCDREVSLTENASGQEFMQALKGWSAISNNIFLWDYGINFDNFVSPFPNFHILQDNIKLFKKYGASMHFSQIGGSRGGDFAELRAFLVSKLMWNPNADVDSLTQHFLNGYYGKAAPFLYQYIKIMEGALLGSGQRLWIYDSPVSHKKGMLKPELIRRYNNLFDQAEKAVAEDSTLLKRVQRSRLPLQYSELEIARTENRKAVNDILQKLNLFEQKVKEFNIPTLNERNNSPVEYCELYRKRYLPQNKKNLATGATITYLTEPTGKYAAMNPSVLVDGLFGGSTFVESWVGWEGKDAAFVIDMGKEKTVCSIESDFLHQLGAWIFFPKEVSYSYSTDGKSYTLLEKHEIPEDRSVEVKFKSVKSILSTPIPVRYFKIEIIGIKECPSWHYGVGHPAWFFLDEITVL
ncbi:MAG: DUF4838 domain-containing protein [Bacteroidia bacterium]|nr:DUF4838 domain-containing protein [Bacteroidia bacterium]